MIVTLLWPVWQRHPAKRLLCLLPLLLCAACARHQAATPSPPKPDQAVARLTTQIPKLERENPDKPFVLPAPHAAPFPSIDDRYGPGELGPRILLHTHEVTEVSPQRLELTPIDLPDDLPATMRDALHQEAPESQNDENTSRPFLSDGTLDFLAGKDPKPRKSRPIRVWDIRRPRSTPPSPIQPAQYNALTYLQTLGLKSIYDLSPLARKLIVPKKHWPRLAFPYIPQRASDPTAPTRTQWLAMINEAAHFFGLDPAFVTAMIQVESNFDHRAISKAGAQGAMQIMPKTQELLGLQDPFDARANIYAGCAYIRALLDRYKRVDLALAGYNAGPGAVDKACGIPPYRETQNYVRKVMELWQPEAVVLPPLNETAHKPLTRNVSQGNAKPKAKKTRSRVRTRKRTKP